jgi:hypothetical protein
VNMLSRREVLAAGVGIAALGGAVRAAGADPQSDLPNRSAAYDPWSWRADAPNPASIVHAAVLAANAHDT